MTRKLTMQMERMTVLGKAKPPSPGIDTTLKIQLSFILIQQHSVACRYHCLSGLTRFLPAPGGTKLMHAKTMEGLAGASMSMKLMNTPIRVYKEAERRGSLRF